MGAIKNLPGAGASESVVRPVSRSASKVALGKAPWVLVLLVMAFAAANAGVMRHLSSRVTRVISVDRRSSAK